MIWLQWILAQQWSSSLQTVSVLHGVILTVKSLLCNNSGLKKKIKIGHPGHLDYRGSIFLLFTLSKLWTVNTEKQSYVLCSKYIWKKLSEKARNPNCPHLREGHSSGKVSKSSKMSSWSYLSPSCIPNSVCSRITGNTVATLSINPAPSELRPHFYFQQKTEHRFLWRIFIFPGVSNGLLHLPRGLCSCRLSVSPPVCRIWENYPANILTLSTCQMTIFSQRLVSAEKYFQNENWADISDRTSMT